MILLKTLQSKVMLHVPDLAPPYFTAGGGGGGVRHFAFAFRAITPAEGRYAQIEMELLSVVFARKMFDTYLGHCACENRSSAIGNYA